MARKKSITDLSSDELYALAQERKLEEELMQKEAIKEQIDELKAQRRELAAKHKKELAAVDAEIRRLGGRTRSRQRSGVNVAETVLQIVQSAGEISTKDIKVELDKQGVAASNLSQTLAYLKRQGRVVSPARSMYSPA
jgi:hypothetical protein